jgi:hypothetical protein
MKCINRLGTALLTIGVMLLTPGCSTFVDAAADVVLDTALPTPEERHVRADYERLSKDKPLKYHRNERDLLAHDIQETVSNAHDSDDDFSSEDSAEISKMSGQRTTVKREHPLPSQVLDAPRTAGMHRVLFYNDSSLEVYSGVDRIGIKLDGKGVEAPYSGQYVQIDLPSGKYSLELDHFNYWHFHDKYLLEIKDTDVYLRVYCTLFATKFKSSPKEPSTLRKGFMPIIQEPKKD